MSTGRIWTRQQPGQVFVNTPGVPKLVVIGDTVRDGPLVRKEHGRTTKQGKEGIAMSAAGTEALGLVGSSFIGSSFSMIAYVEILSNPVSSGLRILWFDGTTGGNTFGLTRTSYVFQAQCQVGWVGPVVEQTWDGNILSPQPVPGSRFLVIYRSNSLDSGDIVVKELTGKRRSNIRVTSTARLNYTNWNTVRLGHNEENLLYYGVFIDGWCIPDSKINELARNPWGLFSSYQAPLFNSLSVPSISTVPTLSAATMTGITATGGYPRVTYTWS